MVCGWTRTKRSRPRLTLAVGVLVLCSTSCGGGEELPTSCVLITLDTTNAKALDVYGQNRGLTPQLFELSQESVIFTRAHTVAPITLPAHTSMMTGLYPLRHGVRDNGMMTLSQDADTIAELAAEAGFETAAFISARVLSSVYGLDQGFDVYDAPPEAKRAVLSHIVERKAPAVTDEAVAWLQRRDRERPFFLWVHYFDPHLPYDPPAEFLKLAGGKQYQAEVAAMDSEIGRLLDALREEVGLDELVLSVVADHGEAFHRHGEPTHSAYIYEETTRVPFMVRFPGARRAGERSKEVVSVVDLYPTFLDAMGLPIPGDLDGLSLSRGQVPEDRGVYLESYSGYINYGWSPLAGWVDAKGKYLHSSNPEYYDLATDPEELHNLLGEGGRDPSTYVAALEALSRRPRLAVGGAAEINEEQRAELRALGYATAGDAEAELPDPLEPSERPAPVDSREQHLAFSEALALAYGGEESREEAYRLLRRVLEENPSNLQARETLGGLLVDDNRPAEAIEFFEGMLADGHDGYTIRACAGWACERMKRFAEAEQHYVKALEKQPGTVKMVENLERIRRRLRQE